MSEVDHEYLNAAAELFEMQRKDAPSVESERLAARIWAALCADLPEDLRGAAYWALGKRCRKEEKELLTAALQREITRSSSVCYQIMIALDNLDEPVFAPERSGASIFEGSSRNRVGRG